MSSLILCALLAQPPAPILEAVHPPGGQAGTTFKVALSGTALDAVRLLHTTIPRFRCENGEGGAFSVTIPSDTAPGWYDLWAVGPNGVSSPRTFAVSNRKEILEVETPDVPLDVVINGRIEEKGDTDLYRFAARRGQLVIVECWAERIDSRLAAVLELYDGAGRRLHVPTRTAGTDPRLVLRVPADGAYTVKLFDLVYAGGPGYFYRLDLDTGPRVELAQPAVVEAGRTTNVTLHGWNLGGEPSAGSDWEQVTVEVTPPPRQMLPPLRLWAHQVTAGGFAYQFPGACSPILLGLSDVPVVLESESGDAPGSAQEVAVPCEVSGCLSHAGERDSYSFHARRGEVLWLEAFGERIGSAVDLDVRILDASGERELTRLADETRNPGGTRFPSSHLDPAGRWVAPADGSYLVLVQSLTGGLEDDPSRIYRLSLRREEPDFELVALSRESDRPAGLNVERGGRTLGELIAFRKRGLDGTLRVSAVDLPTGLECPDVYLGPGVDRVPLVLTARDESPAFVGHLRLVGRALRGGDGCAGPALERAVRGGTMVLAGEPNGSGRLAGAIPCAVASAAPVLVTARAERSRHSQGSIVDIAVDVERRSLEGREPGPVVLTGICLPEVIANRTAALPADRAAGDISFYLPPSLPPGSYTLALRATTTFAPAAGKKDGDKKEEKVEAFSNPVTVEVYPAPFVLRLDPGTPRKVRRGETVQVSYTAERRNGFIGKIHTDLEAPGGVVGLRARGVTFVGQTDSGTIQIIASEDAPLGQQPFLRFGAVGTVEDRPVHWGGCFLELEIVQ